jgi:hypothetical protein
MDKVYRLKSLIIGFFLFSLTTFASGAQESIDLSKISDGKIEIDLRNLTDHYLELIPILSLSIELTLHNIANARTTRTTIPDTPFLYHYLKVFPDYSFQVMKKEKIKFVYNPSHPDAIYSKDGLHGYVKYPDINVEQEYNDILEIVRILIELESGTPR